MNIHAPNGFTFQGLYCYPNPQQDLSYYYLPNNLQPQRDAAGKPVLMLVTVGSGAYLQLSIRWDTPEATLEALRLEIARREQLENSDLLRLAFAPVTVQDVLFLLGDGSGNFTTLQHAHSSGFPPYSTLFNLSLNAAQSAQVAAALNGRDGFAQILYEASLQGFVVATATLTGDATKAIALLKQSLDQELDRKQEQLPKKQPIEYIRESILSGGLQLNLNNDDNATKDLLERTQARVLSQAADLLLHFLDDQTRIPDITRLDVSATLTESVAIALPLNTDIATWFQSGTGAGQITPAPGITPKPLPREPPTTPPDSSNPVTSKPLTVHLAFPATDAPIGLIQLRQGQAQATLAPPDLTAVELPGGGVGELVNVATSYTAGGAAYECQTTVPKAGELALTPGHLGLVRVTIDAQSLEQAGAKKARIRVRYQPEKQGIADEHTFYFRDPDWQANWFLISRSDSLAGILAYEWQVTTANEELIKHEWIETMSPQIVLNLKASEP